MTTLLFLPSSSSLVLVSLRGKGFLKKQKKIVPVTRPNEFSHDVSRLEVPMKNVPSVQVFQGARNAAHHTPDGWLFECPLDSTLKRKKGSWLCIFHYLTTMTWIPSPWWCFLNSLHRRTLWQWIALVWWHRSKTWAAWQHWDGHGTFAPIWQPPQGNASNQVGLSVGWLLVGGEGKANSPLASSLDIPLRRNYSNTCQFRARFVSCPQFATSEIPYFRRRW